MWMDKQSISRKAYIYCGEVKDDPKVRKHITDELDAYCYCRYIKDDPEVRKYVTNKNQIMTIKLNTYIHSP